MAPAADPSRLAHWREYLIEAWGLGTFMVVAAAIGTLLQHPASPVRMAIASDVARRALMGVAMGSTAMAIIYSRWGQRSGAHINPAVTLTFLRLGKVRPWDATMYIASQFAGGVAGIAVVSLVLGGALADPSVEFVATVPGPSGPGAAFVAELVISAVLMTMVLNVTNRAALARFAGVFAGLLVATYIFFESPISGMSMNPARTLGSAIPARLWMGLWIYFTAPPLGMLAAAEAYVRRHGRAGVLCAKFRHPAGGPCIFRCGYEATPASSAGGAHAS